MTPFIAELIATMSLVTLGMAAIGKSESAFAPGYLAALWVIPLLLP